MQAQKTFSLYFLFSIPFITYSIAHFPTYIVLILLSNTMRRLTCWAMSSVKVTFDDEEEMVIVREQEGRREKVAGTHVIADAKFQRRASPRSRKGHEERSRALLLGDARRWNLASAIT